MKQIIFSKYSAERSRRFAIRTDILQDENGMRRVEKHPLYPEGVAHVANISRWYQLLGEEYAESGLFVNRCEEIPGGVRLEYLTGETLQERILTLAKQKRETELLACVKQYLDKMTEGKLIPFEMTEQFVEVFGEAELPAEVKCRRITNIDMIFSNLLLVGDEWHFIDYEWTFDFPVPVNFVLYRAFFLASNEIGDADCIRFERMMEQLGIGEKECREYAKMEERFQQYIRGNETPVRDIMTEIGYRVIPMAEIDERMRRNNLPKLRTACLETKTEVAGNWKEISPESSGNGMIFFRERLPEGKSHLAVQIGAGSALILIKQILLDGISQPVEELTANGIGLGGGLYLFLAETAEFVIPCEESKMVELSFAVQRIVSEINRELIHQINGLYSDRIKLEAETIRLQGENEDFKNSKAYRLYKLTRSNR